MARALPIHPTLVHPVTGKPLRAVFVSEKTGRVFWPVIGADDSPEAAAAAAAAKATADAAAAKAAADAAAAADADKGYPNGTPVEQMKPEQQAAYWKHHARKHEDRAKVFGALTADQLKELQDKAKKHDELELELGTTAEKAAAKARQEATDAAQAENQPQVISAKLDAAAARAGVSEEDLAKAIEFVDTKKFLAADGSVDADKVKTFISNIAPAKGNPQKGPTVHGHGSGIQPAGGSGRDKGKAEAERRFGKQSA